MPVSAQILEMALRKVNGFNYSRVDTLDNLAKNANASLLRAPKGLTPAGAASFIGQQMQESLFFHYLEEQPSKYASSRSVYKGRTFIGVTGIDNYRSCSKYAYSRGLVPSADYFVKYPAALAQPKFAWLGADWFFATQKGLWNKANAGNNLAVGQWINMGPGAVGGRNKPLGWVLRDQCYQALLVNGSKLLPSVPTPNPGFVAGPALSVGSSGARVKVLQNVLVKYFKCRLVVDGQFGPATKNAVVAVQKYLKLSADGIVGPATQRAIFNATKQKI